MASLSEGRTAAAQCGLFTHKSVPVIFEPPCILAWKKFDFQAFYEDQCIVMCSSAWQSVSSVTRLPSRAHPFTDAATWSTRHVIIIDPLGPIDHSAHTWCWFSVSTEIVISEKWSSQNWAWCRVGRQLYTSTDLFWLVIQLPHNIGAIYLLRISVIHLPYDFRVIRLPHIAPFSFQTTLASLVAIAG